MRRITRAVSLNHLVGAREQRGRHLDAEYFRGLVVFHRRVSAPAGRRASRPLGQCFTVPKAPVTLGPHPHPIAPEVSLGLPEGGRPAACHDACPVGDKHHHRPTPAQIRRRARRAIFNDPANRPAILNDSPVPQSRMRSGRELCGAKEQEALPCVSRMSPAASPRRRVRAGRRHTGRRAGPHASAGGVQTLRARCRHMRQLPRRSGMSAP
jgi:hypothetical protein